MKFFTNLKDKPQLPPDYYAFFKIIFMKRNCYLYLQYSF